MLFERLTLHYAGAVQVKKGCSIARTAAAKVGGPPPPTFGANLKCADCGKYVHAGGDEKCDLYKDMVAYTEARAKHEALVASLPPPPQKPVAEKKSPKAKTVPTSAQGASAAAAHASDEQEELAP